MINLKVPLKVLFICIHNAARSQMAEAFLNKLGNGEFYAESAGLEAGTINPLVIEVMAELGYDLSKKDTHSVFDYFKEGRRYDVVVKMCDQLSGQKCPVFPTVKIQLSWGIPDPASFTGSVEERLNKTREIRDIIKKRIGEFIDVFHESAM